MKYLKNVSTLSYNKERCTGCGRCVEVCPHGVFIVKDRKAVITDRNRCMECSACMRNCAFGALTVDSGVGCAAALFFSMLTGKEPACGCSDDSSGGCC